MASPSSMVKEDALPPARGGGVGGVDADDDERAPFISSGPPAGQGDGAPFRRPGGRHARWEVLADSARAALRRLPRPRNALARVAGGASSLRGLCQWLAVCALLVAAGAGASLALRQALAPEVEALARERQELHAELAVLRTQLDNESRVAASRLDTIHLLENELEKQAVQAAAAARADGSGAPPLRAGALDEVRVAPTLAYTALLGSLVLLLVLARIARAAQSELLARRPAGARGGPAGGWGAGSSSSRSARGALGDGPAAARGPGGEPAPRCYKRPQGDRLIV